MSKHIIKEGQIYASYCPYWDSIDIILITKEHDELEGFWFYQYQWLEWEQSVSIITPKHLNKWEYIGEL